MSGKMEGPFPAACVGDAQTSEFSSQCTSPARPQDGRVAPTTEELAPFPTPVEGCSSSWQKVRNENRKEKQNNKTSVSTLMKTGWWEVCFSFFFFFFKTRQGEFKQTSLSICTPVFAFGGAGSGLGPAAEPPLFIRPAPARQQIRRNEVASAEGKQCFYCCW